MAQTERQNMCNCVVFRVDDIQDYWINSVQVQLMNIFLAKGQNLSLGIIMNSTGNDQMILQKIKEGENRGLFELDIHGWNHVDYTKLSEQEQKNTLEISNVKMQYLFGAGSNVFIPPYDLFNNSTLAAMEDSEIRILSASISQNDNRFIWSPSVSNEPYSVYQLPITVEFSHENPDGIWQDTSNSEILNSIDKSITEKGYAIVLLHPQNFAMMENGQFVNVTNGTQLSRLSSLIDSVLDKKIHITTFENVVGLNSSQNQVKKASDLVNKNFVSVKSSSSIPEFPFASIVLLAGVFSTLVIYRTRILRSSTNKYRKLFLIEKI